MIFRRINKKSSKLPSYLIPSLITVVLIAMISVAYFVRRSYVQNLRPVSQTSKIHYITIETGSTPSQIAEKLADKGAIRSNWAFEWYVRQAQARDQLKAGTYAIDENQSVQEIVKLISSGKVATDLITILPGKNLEQIAQKFEESGFSKAQVEAALKPELYQNDPALTDKPSNASLEGYLYPETFQKTADTSLEKIITLSLDETHKVLSPDIRQAITKQGLNLHQAITIASIIENEVPTDEDRPIVAQVFLKRLKEGMRLESNATDEYSKKNPAYDTYKISGLPPGPISNFTKSSIDAVAYPASTDWTYFVSGDDKRTHFSKTLEDHEANIKKYCTKQCGN